MMTDAIKLTDMHMQQRTNIEFERQRHLANWLIESSPHMPKPSQPQQQQQKNKGKKLFTTSIFHDSFLFLSKFGPQTNGGQNDTDVQQQQTTVNGQLIIPKSAQNQPQSISQTNLPLQIVQSSRDGNKPKLRRFNSHDTSANMFSVAEFENARLARRNEMELVRQKQRYKMNSLSSGCDSSTGDSKGSKLSSESKPEPMSSEAFLDRYSLPRIARLIAPKSIYELHQQQQQQQQLSQSNSLLSKNNKKQQHQNHYLIHPNPNSSAHQSNGNINGSTDELKTDSNGNNNGELFLLYRHLKNYRIYHVVNSKSGTNRKKGIKIPQDFSGYFSLVNEKGSPTATLYTTMIQLVRERVYKFLSVDNMQAYTESSADNLSSKSHYVKITAKAGQIFRLLAVFEDGGQDNKNPYQPKKDGINSIGREKEKGRYVQLLSESRQIIYVALSTKGKFYEIEQNVPQLFQKQGSNGSKKKQLSADCVHRISSIINDETVFPVNLKFISKQINGTAYNANIPENIKVTKVTVENSVIACPIDEIELCNPLHLVKVHLFPDMKFLKCSLGFENEKIMFSNPNVQNLLKFCQFNCDNFVRAIDYENLPKEEIIKSTDNLNGTTSSSNGKEKLKLKTSSAFSKFFSINDKHQSAHEKEDSIIFLSKNDLENLENQKQINNDQLNNERTKLNQANVNKKSWFKSFIPGNVGTESTQKSGSIVNLSVNKSHSMDRYQDMSKLIQERFGNIDVNGDAENGQQTTTNNSTMKSSSEISYDLNDRTNKAMQKCFSLQNIELNNSMDIQIQPPDLVKMNHHRLRRTRIDEDKIEKDLTFNSHGASSNDSTLNSFNDDSKNLINQQSFITEKLFNEFYVKTKQYSKSSSSLHQLLHFSVPQKMNIREMKKLSEEAERKSKLNEEMNKIPSALAQLQLPPPPPIDDDSIEPPNDEMDDDSIITDELPYCSVRDSIFVQERDEHIELQTPTENIYAEICQSNTTTPIASETTSEFSYKHLPITTIATNNNTTRITTTNQTNVITSIKQMKNVSSIKISFDSESHTILTNGANTVNCE